MKLKIGLLTLVAALLLVPVISTATLAADQVVRVTHVIEMKSISYEPKKLEITQGERVVWKNVSYTDHSATSSSGTPAFDTGMVHPGKKSKPVSFETPGQYEYHCSVHGVTMSGNITVKAAGP